MARILDTITLAPGQPLPSLGVLLGTRVSSDVFASINDQGHKSFFGSEFDDNRNEFFMRYVQPMDQVSSLLTGTINALMNPDQFRILQSIEDFQSIPPCMELSIALFAPVREGILQGRMEGFGYDPVTLGEDFYGRMIDNFTCEDVGSAMNEEGEYEVKATLYSHDPDLTDDQLYAVRKTREYILNKILADTERDPTAIELPRG